jgi:hypothetical protein
MVGHADPPFARVDAHHDVLLSLVERAEREARSGRLEAAAVRAQIAGTFAWKNHAGIFASQALERLLVDIGSRLPVGGPGSRAIHPDPVNVLHVVTQVYESGGSTQGLTSWIEQDAGRRHSVALTRQGAGAVPRKLVAALRSDSDLLRVDTSPGGLLGRAARLRAAAEHCDCVLLHPHPDDAVPVIAFGGDVPHPPLIFVNHADHVFWLGVSVAQTLMNMRDSGDALAVRRRGIDPSRCHVMARPLRFRERTLTRADAKRRLGIDPSRLVILTAADGTKYRPIGDVSFIDLLVPVIARYPEIILLAAGPAAEDEAWRAAAMATGGRVRALGRLTDVSPVHQAADLYVDSFPFSSLTSLLEAGSYGTAVASYRGHAPESAVLGADTRGLDEHLVTAADPGTFRDRLSELIEDRLIRESLGERTETAIKATHTGAGWQEGVASLYAFAAHQPAPVTLRVPSRDPDQLDVLVELVMNRTGFARGQEGALTDNLALLPFRDRLAAWISLTRKGRTPALTRLVPEWLHPRLARWRQQLMRRR